MMHLLGSIQVLHYSYEPNVESPCVDAERNCLISNKCVHHRDIAFSLIVELVKPLANVFFDVRNPRAYHHGHHKMLKSAGPHVDEYMSPVVDQVYSSSSSVSHGMDEAQEDRTHHNKLLDHFRVVCDTAVLGVFFTLKRWIFRFFPRFCAL
jgi:hypothetical protein